ncbi:MAG: T9SS type A sorting domain-containing protein [Ferruginibacter sp.]
MKRILIIALLLTGLTSSYAQSGALDKSFGINGIINSDMGTRYDYGSSARQVLLGPDGSMFLLLNDDLITKRLPNGSMDSTYGVNGYSGTLTMNDTYAAQQPDGKIVIAGSRDLGSVFVVARLNPNGTPDSTFGNEGSQVITINPKAVDIQTDGKIVLAGSVNDIFAVARMNADGSPDNTFSEDGEVTTTLGVDFLQYANAIAIQADGKILAGGYAYSDLTGKSFVIARYNVDGSPDNLFDIDGVQTTDFAALDATGYSLAIQADGKIILAGFASDGSTNRFALARYTINGSPDNSFNLTGMQTTDLGSDMQIGNSVAIQSTGKILVGGYTFNGASNDFAIARFNTDGSPDNSFDNDGILTTDLAASDDYAGSLLVRNDDKIILAGYANSGIAPVFAVTRFNADGTPDNSFDTDGKLVGSYGQGFTSFSFSAIQVDGKIVSAGRTWNGTDFDFAIARFNSNGTPDNTFSEDGKIITDFGGTDDAVSVVVQPDGKIVVAGNSDSRFAICRFNPNGSTDNTFSLDGKLIVPMGFGDDCRSAALQADGKILLAGSTYADPNYDSAYFVTARINSDGSTDNLFSGDGKQFTNFEGSSSFGSSLAVQNDGKIVVAGRSYINNQNNFSVARYNIDGSPDNTFSQDGKQNNVFGADGYSPESLAIQKDGKLVLAGYSEDQSGSSSAFAVARYNPNGSLDPTFGEQGFQSTYLGDNFNFGRSVAINADGRIAVAGTDDNYAIVLYKSNGTRDSSFGNNGIQSSHIGTGASSIQHILFRNNNLYATGSGQFPGILGVLSRYLLSEGGPLPVSLLDFKAIPQNKTVQLQWQTASEQGVSGFVIERSADGINFSEIGYTRAAGNSTVKKAYATTDVQPLPGINFYRLKIIDIDGTFNYSEIVTATIRSELFTWKVFPNPAQNILYVTAQGENEKATFIITDVSGRKLKEVKVSLLTNGSFPVYINSLPNGVYNLQMKTKTKSETLRFLKE